MTFAVRQRSDCGRNVRTRGECRGGLRLSLLHKERGDLRDQYKNRQSVSRKERKKTVCRSREMVGKEGESRNAAELLEKAVEQSVVSRMRECENQGSRGEVELSRVGLNAERTLRWQKEIKSCSSSLV